MDGNLSQEEAEFLIKLKKVPVSSNDNKYIFPNQQKNKLSIPLKSEDGKNFFVFDINRNKIKLSKITYLNRTKSNVVLIRLDLNGAPHRNPDGKEVSGSHLHVYKEGYNDKFAVELPAEFRQISSHDIKQFFTAFMQYCNICGLSDIMYKPFMDNIV